jgi:FAD/FMN-containing dehydrogenase
MHRSELHALPTPRSAVLDQDRPGAGIPSSRIAGDDVADLRSRVHGPVYLAGDDGLAAEVATWNVAIQHTPAVAVGATCAEDVAAAVSFARSHGLPVAVQATGHGPVRNAAGSLMITTRRMQGVHVDPVRRTARVQAGVKWERVMEAAGEHGLAGMRGSSSDVGVVGYTLGGGLGSFGRKHGFAADHVRSVELVTADGRIRTVDAETDPELFWAVRGGKGNLGIVTTLEIELLPIRSLVGGGVFFDGEDAAQVLHAYRRWSAELPEEATTSVAIMRMPPLEFIPEPLQGRTVVHVRYAWIGEDLAEGERRVQPMIAAGRVLLGFIGPMLATEMDAIHMDPVDPLPAWEKGMGLAELPEEAVDALLAVAGPQVDIPMFIVELRQLGGALARQPQVPNAVAGRSLGWELFLLAPGVPELAEITPLVADGLMAAMAPWAASGSLLNHLGHVAGPEDVARAYPPDVLDRLRAVKRTVDPDNLFRFGHAI